MFPAVDRLRQRPQLEGAVGQPKRCLDAAPAEPQREQAFIGEALPVAGEAREVVDIDRLGGRHAPRRPIAEAAANTGFLQCAQVFLGMPRGDDVVAPVVHGGDAGEQRLGRRQQRAVIHVARRVDVADRRGGRKISVLRRVAGHVAEQRRPHVPMGVDQAGHQDEALAVDDLSAGRCQAGAHFGDLAVLHPHVAIGQVGRPGHHRHDIGVADHHMAAAGQVADRRRHRRIGRHRERTHAECRGAAEELPAMNRERVAHGHPPRPDVPALGAFLMVPGQTFKTTDLQDESSRDAESRRTNSRRTNLARTCRAGTASCRWERAHGFGPELGA